jgi:hypothetical protein
MSVDYSAHIYYGYDVTPEDLKHLSEETIDELMDREYLHRIDCYSEHSRMILGYDIKETENIIFFSNATLAFAADPLTVIKLYYDCFGEMPKLNPNFYLAQRVS